ncbi:flavodoxin domain-containing protein [Streptomyces alkaliterrae]|uniref:Flavodoxin n=1 Tax=Streptomyces alkaliterrae TaxID=2213162 RepID=A0A5P0Z050_9ACTN|nr:flavodoxin domain-containing protein [Streptomyces alkaliterrae]MBB1262114.1 flavodoxin domain-containing protein [Streptomyces alkaliterrae]MQS04899.1 flavodoxin [Streptomyces alkaliterrae]
MDVLVGYASAHGSTREIAERLGDVLRGAGLGVEVREMARVDDARAYRAFVLGSAVHGQRWLDPALGFVRENLGVLADRPVWLFSVGMPAALRGPWRRLAPKEVPVIEEALGGLPRREHRLFSGVVSPALLPRRGRLFFRLVGGRFGDYRDWAAVESWAAEIAGALSAE